MSTVHMGVLYCLLVFLGFSLIGPGLAGMFRYDIGRTWLIAEGADARSHLRGLNGGTAALGMIAFWACWDLERSRQLVLAIGVVLTVLVLARLYSILVDGRPGSTTFAYLAVEAVVGSVFLLWPPPPMG